MATITTFVFAGHMILVKGFYYFPFQMLTGILLSFFYFFNKKRMYYFTLYWSYSILILNIFYCSFELPGSGVEYFLIPLSVMPFTIIDNKVVFKSLMAFAGMVFFASFFLKDRYSPHDAIDPMMMKLTYVIVLTAVFILCGIIIFRFKKVNANYEAIIEEQKQLVEDKNKEMIDSIRYAQRIQKALMSNENYISSALGRLIKKIK
jgi:sigma-B regulation protein RsbU (phosphoserine phosphatase)